MGKFLEWLFIKVVYVAPMKALAAEMTESFSKRLNPLGISVRELTGDMQLTKNEILQTQVRSMLFSMMNVNCFRLKSKYVFDVIDRHQCSIY